MSLKRFAIYSIIAAMVLGLIAFSGCNKSEEVPKYETVTIEASIVKITDNPNVREEPILHDREESNSLGTVQENGFTIAVSGNILKAEIDFNNGAYYGFQVDDILSQPEGINWFPSKISNDADGIVWINHKYVTILY